MARRIHLHRLEVGEIKLNSADAHHARDVLRLAAGTVVEVFDDAGNTAEGTIVSVDVSGMTIRVDMILSSDPLNVFQLTIASAIPKGDRADWMIEKLSDQIGGVVGIQICNGRQ